jgi:hypothetical protein
MMHNVCHKIDNIKIKKKTLKTRMSSFITEDKKFLCLSYNNNISDGSSEESYNIYFDQLDNEQQIYTKVEKLELETDFINEIPKNVSKFIKLKELHVKGSRFWNLEMSQISTSVEVLYLTDHSNLSRGCVNGMDKLTNLSSVYLDFYPFNFLNIFEFEFGEYQSSEDSNEDNIIPIPNLPKLKFITFCSGILYSKEDVKSNWQSLFTEHQLFSNIKTRIASVEIDNNGCFDIKVTLNDHNN